MSKFSAFRGRMGIDGNSHQESMVDISKRRAKSYILSSPTRSDVDIVRLKDMGKTLDEQLYKKNVPSIVSNKDSFYRREILTPYDLPTVLGDYVKHQSMTYLVNETNLVDIYPNSFMIQCNYMLKIIKHERVFTGKTDWQGKPEWENIEIRYDIPCAIESKEYSIAENSAIPLPDGVINISIPYHEKLLEDVPVNYLAKFSGDTYQITSINEEKVFLGESGRFGFLVLRGQLVVDSDVKGT